MAINKKLIHFKRKEVFDEKTANNEILDTSIVFIQDSKEISTHGTVYKSVNWSVLKPQIITFTIDGTEYQAEEGMTWGEWIDSKYNTNGYHSDDGEYVYTQSSSSDHIRSIVVAYESIRVNIKQLIIKNRNYIEL